MLITLFTPTYNRAHLLSRLYESLKAQTYTDFEWLIVDDGSSDNTAAVVEGFVAEMCIDIRYVQKPNGGKHTAINLGVREARGTLFFIADSDDFLPTDALALVKQHYRAIEQRPEMAGVCGLDQYEDGSIVGSGLPQEVIETSAIDLRQRLDVTGDMKEIFRTDILRQFPFPEIEGERFCPEALVWTRIAQKYQLRFFNRPIYIAEYQPNGLTDNIVRIRRQSPVATMMTYAEQFALPIPFAQRVKAAINYWRFSFCAKKRSVGIALWAYPFALLGWLMHVNDKKVIR